MKKWCDGGMNERKNERLTKKTGMGAPEEREIYKRPTITSGEDNANAVRDTK